MNIYVSVSVNNEGGGDPKMDRTTSAVYLQEQHWEHE